MPLWHAIVLAVVQGLTEFLPISSSGHLALTPWLLGWEEHGLAFDVALHAGTLLAVLIYFHRTWQALLWDGLRRLKLVSGANAGLGDHAAEGNPHLLPLLAVGTIPVGVAGILFQEHVETLLRGPFVIGSAFVLVGLLMAWGERAGKARKNIAAVRLLDAVVIGVAQAVALVPGVSRSGITMTAALLRDFRRDAAARYSFLLSAPAIGGAALKTGVDLYREGIPPGMEGPFLIGIALSALVGYATISLFLRFLQFGTFKIFVYYRILFGIIVLALATLGIIQ